MCWPQLLVLGLARGPLPPRAPWMPPRTCLPTPWPPHCPQMLVRRWRLLLVLLLSPQTAWMPLRRPWYEALGAQREDAAAAAAPHPPTQPAKHIEHGKHCAAGFDKLPMTDGAPRHR
jgi:hypothetical protein